MLEKNIKTKAAARPKIKVNRRPKPPTQSTDNSGYEADIDEAANKRIFKQRSTSFTHPRSEFRPRLKSSTSFSMEDPQYWNTYSRSGKCRNPRTISINTLDTPPKKKMGFHAKAGTFSNPFSSTLYGSLAPTYDNNSAKFASLNQNELIYDQLISYRLTLCTYIIDTLSEKNPNIIINADNQYPCLLLKTPGIPTTADIKKEKLGTAEKNWSGIVMAYLLAIINKTAWRKGIPIEIVMRASFGHNLPSLAECGPSIRINTGLIPIAMANCLVDSIIELNDIFHREMKATLEAKIIAKDYVQTQKNYQEKSNNATDKIGVCETTPIWNWLWSVADTKNKTVAYQILRMHKNIEGLADQVYATYKGFKEPTIIQLAEPLVQISGHFNVDGKKLTLALPPGWYDFKNKRGDADIAKTEPQYDDAFWHIIKTLGSAIRADALLSHQDKKTIKGLYQCIDQSLFYFIQHYAPLFYNTPTEEDGPGSDSETEADVTLSDATTVSCFSKKIVSLSGMRAIHLARVAFDLFFYKKNAHTSINTKQMYYETPNAIKSVSTTWHLSEPIIHHTNTNAKPKMIFFDLNHCNNLHETTWQANFSTYDVVALDHTSSSSTQIHNAIVEVFSHPNVLLVLLVTSGLKNEQGGSDFNTYGTLRIITRNKAHTDALYNALLTVEGDYKHPIASHVIRRAYKHFGFLLKTRDFLYSDNKAQQDKRDRVLNRENKLQSR